MGLLFGKFRKKRSTCKAYIEQTHKNNSYTTAALNFAKHLPLNDREKAEKLSTLTARERDIYLLLIEGFTLKEAAKQLGIKYSTVNTHITGIYRKLGVKTRAELIINYRNIQQ